MRVVFPCAQCGGEGSQERGAMNRARRRGAPLYCSRTCFGISHRSGKTKAQKVSEKRDYDMRYREANHDSLKTKKHEYFTRTYDPVAAAVVRKARMPKHVEYCRRPEYREWKQGYDRQYRADKIYGDFAGAFLALLDLDTEVNARMSDYDVRVANGTLNKKLQRKLHDGKAYGI